MIRLYSSFILLVSFAALLSLGCGSTVFDETSGKASGSGGSGGEGGGIGGEGGAGGEGGEGGAGGEGGEGGEGGASACGGGIACDDEAYCAFTIPGSCGKGNELGTCAPRPEGCSEACPGVCGCDGVFYCNECQAREAGFDASLSTACFPQAEYKAANLYTAVPRFALFKTDATRGICVRFVLEPSGEQGAGPKPSDPWGYNLIEMTNNLSDCQLGPMGWLSPAAGEVVEPISGVGVFVVEAPPGAPQGCMVSVHGSLEFAPTAPWMPASEPLEVDNVIVDGGCN